MRFLLLALPLVLLLAGCASVQRERESAWAALKGRWKLFSFSCEGGEADATVLANERRINEGLEEEVATFEDGKVTFRSKFWVNASKTGSCEIDSWQTWKVEDGNYQILASDISRIQARGDGKCPESKANHAVTTARPYWIDGDRLKFSVSHSSKKIEPKPGTRVLCNGGDWVRTYQRLR